MTTSDRTPRMLDDAQRAALKHVVAPADPVDLSRYPDFFIIGPQRTGSTWLHRNLLKHPEVFISDPKEIYYFSSVEYPEHHPEHLPPMSPDLTWYLRFFEPREGQPDASVRGEATASYAAAVSDSVIDDMLVLNPNMKALMLVRHPAERGWSHLKKYLSLDRDHPVDAITLDQCVEFFRDPYIVKCGHFSEIIARWRDKLGDQLFVDQFRDIKRDPAGLLSRVWDFLGVDSRPEQLTEMADRIVAGTPKRSLPDSVRPFFDDLYGDEVEKLRAMGFSFD